MNTHTLYLLFCLLCNSTIAQNVGIGTTTPSYKLDVNGNSMIRSGLEAKANPIGAAYDANYDINYFAGGALTLGNNTSNTFRYIKMDGSVLQSYQKDQDDLPASFILNPFGGNIGIGATNPTARLHIFSEYAFQIAHNNNPYMRFSNTAGEEFAYLKSFNTGAGNTINGGTFRGLEIGTPGNAGNKSLLFTTNWTPRMYIDGNGNIGVGTTTPSQKFTVSGTIRSDYMGVNTNNTGEAFLVVKSDAAANKDAIYADAAGTDAYAVRAIGGILSRGAMGIAANSFNANEVGMPTYAVFASPGSKGNFNSYGIYALQNAGTAAGYFVGKVEVSGAFSASTKNFKIDHPLDPENKYLLHSCVESDEMANMYNGTITTNAEGYATIKLPDWFEAENENFRYQLTCIGQFAQAIVKEEISKNKFIIQTDKPDVKISWQVVGNRKDIYAKRSGFKVEQEKEPQDKGKYLDATYYGLPVERSIAYPDKKLISNNK